MKVNFSRLRISKFCKKISSWSFYLSVVYFRKAWLIDGLKWKKEKSKNYPLDKLSVKKVWHGIRINKAWLKFYNNIEREGNKNFDARYLPLDIQYCFIDDWFNDTQTALLLDDKNMYDMFFYDINQPKTIARIISRSFFDENYADLSIEQVMDRCSKQQKVIMKPTIGTSGGSGIVFWNVDEGLDILKKFLLEHDNYVIQEVIRQHAEISKIYAESINSIRIVTCHYNGKTEVLSAVIRMGVNGNKLDNASQGGLFCGINEDGTLKKYAYTKNGDAVTVHPQGAVFSDCRIPSFDKCKTLVIKLSNRFLRIAKLISWDLAIDEEGNPVLIEVNLCYGGTDIHQIANGPLYGDKTEEILDKVFRQSKKYSFINKFVH
jgi:hypothetical protein